MTNAPLTIKGFSGTVGSQAVQEDDGYLMIDGVKLNKRGFCLIQQQYTEHAQ